LNWIAGPKVRDGPPVRDWGQSGGLGERQLGVQTGRKWATWGLQKGELPKLLCIVFNLY